MKGIMKIINWAKSRSLVVKILLVLAVLGLGFFIYTKVNNSSAKPTYQTTKATKSTIIVSVSASGVVSTANSAQVTTAASGVVSNIYIENGQHVNSGEALAQLDLDLQGKQRMISAWTSYQSAKNSLFSLQSTMLTKWKTYMDSATSGTYQNADSTPIIGTRQLPQFVSTSDDWLAAEAQYKNQQNAIDQAWITYQLTSPTIYAPISGTVTGFGLQIGSVITAQSNSSGGATNQKIASVITQATPTVTVSLTEIDVPRVVIGDKATVTLDAFSGKTYTGKVISIDTVGSVTSGVTTYPAVIKLDTDSQEILTNMSAQANIITNVKDGVITVPSGAVKTSNGQSTVSILVNGVPQTADVQTGLVSTTDTEIISGVSEGDNVVTSVISPTTTQSTTTSSSPFGALGGNRGFGGGGAGGAAVRRPGG